MSRSEDFTPEDVQVMSLAFDELCDLTGFTHPSDTLAAHFAELIVRVAVTGVRDPISLAQAARRHLAGSLSLSRNGALLDLV
jgi:hypothetical protein